MKKVLIFLTILLTNYHIIKPDTYTHISKILAIPGVKEDLLYKACSVSERDFEVISALLELGAQIDYPFGKKEETALMIAVKKNDLQLVQFLLSKGANINCQNIYDETPLIKAIQSQPEMVYFLLENGASPTIGKGTCYSFPPLGVAAYENNIELVNILLDYGVDVSNEPKYFVSALYSGNIEIVKLLLDKGAPIWEATELVLKVMSWKHARFSDEVEKLLINRGIWGK